jgi:hypothetical protein
MPDLDLEKVRAMGEETRAFRARGSPSHLEIKILVNGIPYSPEPMESPWNESERAEMPPLPPRGEMKATAGSEGPESMRDRMARKIEEARRARAEERKEGDTLPNRIKKGINEKEPPRRSRLGRLKESLPLLEAIIIVILVVVILS